MLITIVYLLTLFLFVAHCFSSFTKGNEILDISLLLLNMEYTICIVLCRSVFIHLFIWYSRVYFSKEQQFLK